MRTPRRPLAQTLTRRLTLIAAVVVAFNLLVVGAYYTSNLRSLEAEVVAHEMERLAAALRGAAIPTDAAVRDLYAAHPEAYAFMLMDRSGTVLDGMNRGLIPVEAMHVGADDWKTRIAVPQGHVLVAGHSFADREDGLRAVFVMASDPARLLQRAILGELLEHVWLPVLPMAMLLIVANVLLVRRSLTPVAAAAAWARSLRPGTAAPPPPMAGAPAEIADLVEGTQRALDRLTTALTAESRRAAEAAHALRTPVAVLFARLDALPPSETRDRLHEDLAALSRTVQQVLAAARSDGLEVPEGASLDLRAPARTVTASLAPFAHARGVALSLSVPDVPVLASASAEGVEVALANLVENAVLHGGVGAVEVTVGAGPTIEVRDHGPGLPPGAQGRLLEPFWRGPGAAPGGAGLGLAIVDRLQRAQGGAVEMRTAPGGGCLARLTFSPAEKK